MADVHPLKRKSIKPSSSTVRGMLPGPQCRMLDAAMQSVRAVGLRLEWVWRGKNVGWVCAGFYDDNLVCDLVATRDPLVGIVKLRSDQVESLKNSKSFPKKYKNVLAFPVDEERGLNVYEFPLESTAMRDLFSSFVEEIMPVFEDK